MLPRRTTGAGLTGGNYIVIRNKSRVCETAAITASITRFRLAEMKIPVTT